MITFFFYLFKINNNFLHIWVFLTSARLLVILCVFTVTTFIFCDGRNKNSSLLFSVTEQEEEQPKNYIETVEKVFPSW